MQITLRDLFDGGSIAFLCAVSWKVMRFFSLAKDFPPHRHQNGTILYPFDYEPTKPRDLFNRTHER